MKLGLEAPAAGKMPAPLFFKHALNTRTDKFSLRLRPKKFFMDGRWHSKAEQRGFKQLTHLVFSWYQFSRENVLSFIVLGIRRFKKVSSLLQCPLQSAVSKLRAMEIFVHRAIFRRKLIPIPVRKGRLKNQADAPRRAIGAWGFAS